MRLCELESNRTRKQNAFATLLFVPVMNFYWWFLKQLALYRSVAIKAIQTLHTHLLTYCKYSIVHYSPIEIREFLFENLRVMKYAIIIISIIIIIFTDGREEKDHHVHVRLCVQKRPIKYIENRQIQYAYTLLWIPLKFIRYNSSSNEVKHFLIYAIHFRIDGDLKWWGRVWKMLVFHSSILLSD